MKVIFKEHGNTGTAIDGFLKLTARHRDNWEFKFYNKGKLLESFTYQEKSDLWLLGKGFDEENLIYVGRILKSIRELFY